MQEGKSILLIASWYPTGKLPTYGSFIEEQARLLIDNGNHVTVLYPRMRGSFAETYNKPHSEVCTRHYNGIKVIDITVSPILPGIRGLGYRRICRKALKAVGRGDIPKFEIVHSHSMFMGGVVGSFLSRKLGVPLVHTEHSSGLLYAREQYNWYDRKCINQVMSQAANFVCVSEFTRASLMEAYMPKGRRFCVIPNLVDKRFFIENITPKFTPFRYLSIGSLIPVKNHELLIKSWVRVVEQLPESRLTIIGSGPLKGALDELIREAGIESSVDFYPSVNRSEVADAIRDHHVTVSSSKLETFGLTLAEAAAVGRPIVATDSGGVRDIVNHGNGILAEGTVNGLSEALIDIQRNYRSFDADAITRDARAKFSDVAIYSQLEDLYDQLA